MGGDYPSISKDIACKDENIDCLVVGEGEERLPNLIRAINSSSGFQNVDAIVYREDGKVIENPQNSVYPTRDVPRQFRLLNRLICREK